MFNINTYQKKNIRVHPIEYFLAETEISPLVSLPVNYLRDFFFYPAIHMKACISPHKQIRTRNSPLPNASDQRDFPLPTQAPEIQFSF